MQSVVTEPVGGPQSFILNFANVGDGFPAWGTSLYTRDRLLSNFWPTEPLLAGAMFSTIARYISYPWSIIGNERTATQTRDMLLMSEHGQGWEALWARTLIDLFSQDNGAFIEILRTDDDPRAPTVALNNLDSSRCLRTGNRQEPVIYYDINGASHKLKWYQVIDYTEFPTPKTNLRGIQICAVSRLLGAAHAIKSLLTYKDEKISGRFIRAIHFVGNVSIKQMYESMEAHQFDATSQGLQSFIQPLIVGALDPSSPVSKATIEMASLPDGFNAEEEFRLYIIMMANAFGEDYQDFAPLPGGNLGSAHQSELLHLKSKGKGPALFVSKLTHMLNANGVIPRTVKFQFGEQDLTLSGEQQQLRTQRAAERAARIASTEITPEVARQLALDAGDLDREYLEMMGETNATPKVIVTSNK